MSAAVTRYRIMAYATGVVLILLCISIVFQVLGHPEMEHVTGFVHGVVFYPLYLLSVAELFLRFRLSLGRTVAIALAGTIPVMSFVAERKVTTWLTGKNGEDGVPVRRPAARRR